jgi:PAS domain S-box-containing protein
MSTEPFVNLGTDPINVLLVDDRPDKLLALESILADDGHKVVTARSGAEALRYLLRTEFAVILLDVNMPDMDGFQTAALIRERPRSEKTPIIFLTAVSDTDSHATRGYSLGAVDYIHMPVQPEVLKAKVAVFVDLYRKSTQIRKQAEWMRLVQEREHALRMAEAADRLEFETRRNRFFTLAVDMLGIAGFDGFFRQLNPSWERTLGFPEYELRARPITQFLHPDDREAAEVQFHRLWEGAPTAHFENRHRHRDGTYRWLSWTAAPFREEGLVYVFARDITFRKVAEEERLQLVREQEARRAAQRENELKDEFLATLSHELRAPLTPILGWTSVLRSGRIDAASFERGLDVIDRNVKRQVQLVEDLLDVSRIVSGKLRMDLQPLDPRAVVEAGLEAVRPAATAKRIQIDVDYGPRSLTVLADAARLQQVVWNLAANAVKFTPEGGRVEVRLDSTEGKVRLTVRDDGVGISPEFLPLVFDRFRQATTGSARSHGGLGLGLTIVRHLVEGHGGTVEASSPGVGQGATFVVLLASGVEGEASPTGAKAAPGTGGAAALLLGLKLLVVDDDPEVCEVLRLVLSAQGASVAVAGSVAQALAAFDRERPDLVVSDIGMPGADGYALVENLRSRLRDEGGTVPAIALTAYASAEDSIRVRAAGFQTHLAKPIDPMAVTQAIASLTGRMS